MTDEQIAALALAIEMIKDGPNAFENLDDFVIAYNGLVATHPDETSVPPIHPEIKSHAGWVYVLRSEWGVEYVGLTRRHLVHRLREHARSGSPLAQRQKEAHRHATVVEAYAIDELGDLSALEWAFIHLLEPKFNVSTGRVA